MTRAINWGLPLITAAVYAVLAFHFGGRLIAMADGQLPFDLRITGYTFPEARAYLRVLTPEGFALAMGPIAWLDTVFPVLLGMTLLWWMRPFAGAFGMVCVLAAMSYVALDLGENASVRALLIAGPDWFRLDDVMRASTFTITKFAALALALILALRQSVRRHRAAK